MFMLFFFAFNFVLFIRQFCVIFVISGTEKYPVVIVDIFKHCFDSLTTKSDSAALFYRWYGCLVKLLLMGYFSWNGIWILSKKKKFVNLLSYFVLELRSLRSAYSLLIKYSRYSFLYFNLILVLINFYILKMLI